MFTETFDPFFNVNEFAIQAFIKDISFNGILESLLSTVNQVQCYQFRFTCAQAAIPKVKLNDEVRIANQPYRILEIKPDGTGLMHLLLEAVA